MLMPKRASRRHRSPPPPWDQPRGKDSPLLDAGDILTAALATPIALREGDPSSLGIDQALRQRLMGEYAGALHGLSPNAAMLWLLERLATLEARLLTLQAQALPGALTSEARARTFFESPPEKGTELAQEPAFPPLAMTEKILLPQSLTLPWDSQLECDGLYEPETDATGLPFRWIGPWPRASVLVPRLPGPHEIRLHVFSAFMPELLPELRLSLNGGPWAGIRMEKDASTGRIILIGQPEMGSERHPTMMRLVIDAIETASPTSRGDTDPRALGIAFTQLDLHRL